MYGGNKFHVHYTVCSKGKSKEEATHQGQKKRTLTHMILHTVKIISHIGVLGITDTFLERKV